ncbi:FkbM family methyltransferase [Pseudoalteromonas sp. R3]|uniref:FkbM family methyltransferase n=1 Tax=Pseudoalteromonas sp. R3 TaxID=1709477 RepID=UPI0006B5F837|nr:FkbM family methyltransferase [Pseudoalteromonas sp. R3]AZZ98971.1 FkbM family methyltransferase [Pseudoalteromonas sp. R3]
MNLADNQFYIYGASHFGQALTAHLVSVGLRPRAILDKAPKAAQYSGVSCLTFPEHNLETHYPVIVTILGYSGVESSLHEAGFSEVIDTLSAFELFPTALKLLNECGVLWMQAPRSQQVDETQCQDLLHLLSDSKSRNVFGSIVNYRLNPSRAHYPLPEQYEMYFPEDIPQLYQYEELRVLDVGAFDGDTFAGFFQRYPEALKGYTALEASAKNIQQFQTRLDSMGITQPNLVNIHRLAVGLPAGQKLKVEENASATVVSVVEPHEQVVPDCLVESINLGDMMAKVQCNVLKMDIEGADYDALCQGADYIREHTPTLALSLYHKPEDLWRIPLLIESYAPGRYHYYVRQEGHWLLETQFYAVPKDMLKQQ